MPVKSSAAHPLRRGPSQQRATGDADPDPHAYADRQLDECPAHPVDPRQSLRGTAPAMATRTIGVAIPSLRPLSTVISRRTRAGTTGLVTTGTPSAASVGASAAATSRASHP